MFSATYDRHRQVGQHGRYYATERRRNRYSTFSIMKWFRRSKRYDDDDDDDGDGDSAWFRDDLKRIQQAYMEQDPDYAAVTPIVPRRRPASTWCRWSGSTTTVYSFAYVDGVRRDGGDDDDDDPVEYIDAATLPVARRRTPDCNSSAFRKSPPTDTANGKITATMTATRRRNKRAAPPPPPSLSPLPAVHAAGPSRSLVETVKTTTTTMQRRTATTARKKYRAPQPPIAAPEPRPQQPQQSRRGAPQRRKKGPAPKPPVAQQPQQQQKTAVEPEPVVFSNVRRKITQYERDRLMQRVDKIEKHFFFEKNATAVPSTTGRGGQKPTTATRDGTHGFASATALYTAMAATNLTELDKRAAEICQRRKHGFDAIAEDHKNAIVAAVIRKSYPATVAAAKDTAATKTTGVSAATAIKAAQPSTNHCQKPAVATGETAADDEKQLVRHKRLAFYQQRATVAHGKQQVDESKATESSPPAAAVEKSSLGTQTTGSVVVVAKTPKTTTAGTAVDSADSKHLPCGDSNCYQQLKAMEMQSDLVLHNGPFECTVCLCTYDNNGVVLRDCLHVFCRPCLQMTISHSKAEQVVCPYIDERYSCTGALQHREIKKILDSEEEYERFLQRSVERARQLLAKERDGGSFQCRRPDCTGWCLIYDKNEVFEFKCPVCGTITCVRCGSIHRQGKRCKTIQENCSSDIPATLEDLIGRGDAMICPGCNTILSKQQGCDWIKCAVCFMEICWATKGPRWGPKGKGDTTGGCMCGIPPGRKCHSDCKYCH